MNRSSKKAPRRPARSAAGSADWPFHAANSAVFEALAGRRHCASLREHFGTRAFEELSTLARAAKKAKTMRAERVLVVPGMMGSRLCAVARRGASRLARVLWIDPKRIGQGRLKDLVLPSGKTVRPSGVLLPAYAKLKLELAVQGFEARFHPYDWRLGIEDIGASLAATLAGGRKPAVVIAHSMGALAARVAARQLPKRRLRRLIMLGAPNLGSYAPVLALRGVYPFVQKLSRLDPEHSPDELSSRIFSTFPGLYQMLPPPEHSNLDFDLLDPDCWPNEGPKPDRRLLGGVARARASMAAPDERMVQIVGVNRDTVVGVRRTPEGFEYASSRAGDGTVPVSMAVVPGLKTYFVDELHGNLALNPKIIGAIPDLVRDGSTRALEERFAPSDGAPRCLHDTQLRCAELGKIDWRRLSSAEREAVMADLDGEENASPEGAASLA